jgi:signal transduction histidine kinase
MDWLRDLFETNQLVVLSIHGQVFFVMGLAIALQRRKRSQLALAQALPWLAAFGVADAFVEWGYLFIPVQSGFLPGTLIEGLLWLQLALRGIAFALLLQFGAELLLVTRPARAATLRVSRVPWLRLVAPVAFGLWALGTLAIGSWYGTSFAPDPGPWLPIERIQPALEAVGAPLAVGDVLARWMLALPGAVAVVIGLRRSAASLEAIARPPVGGALRLTAVAFGMYALLEGCISMPAPFLPGSVLNSRMILDGIGIPVEVFGSLVGLAMAVGVIRSLDLFEQETDRRLAEARRRELLARERDRIGRDLHDGIIQSIYAAGLHLEEARSASGDPRRGIGLVLGELERVTGEIRRTIFDLRSSSLDARDPERLVAAVADELRAHGLLDITQAVEGRWRAQLDDDQAEHLRLIVRETLSNVLRHADASHVELRLDCSAERLLLEIHDDGRGFDPTLVPTGVAGGPQGLANLRGRAVQLGGRLEVNSAPGRGTTLSLTMPVAAVRREP